MKETCRGTFVCWFALYHLSPVSRNNKFSRLAFVSISYKYQTLTFLNFSAVLLSVNCRFYVCASICDKLALCHLIRRSYRVEQSQHLFQLVRCLIGYFNLYHGWLLSAYSFRNVAINTSIYYISVRNKTYKHLPFPLASCASVKSSTLVFSCVLSISAYSWFFDCSRTFAFVRNVCHIRFVFNCFISGKSWKTI